jgi:hypothetical protein
VNINFSNANELASGVHAGAGTGTETRKMPHPLNFGRNEVPAFLSCQANVQDRTMTETGTFAAKVGLAEMPKGGVIMDVTDASKPVCRGRRTVAVMARARAADIPADGGVAACPTSINPPDSGCGLRFRNG